MCRLSIREVVVIALDIAQALQRVHSKQVVHQDVHGGNVLQALDGSGFRLTDFGNASWMLKEDGTSITLDCPW